MRTLEQRVAVAALAVMSCGGPTSADPSRGTPDAVSSGAERQAVAPLDDEDEATDPEIAELASALVGTKTATPGPHTVQARIVGLNDFHGQIVEGRLVGGRPVGGAAVLASYMKASLAGFDGASLIVHAGDHVGASPPESALLQDEPSISFLNLFANPACVSHGYTNPDCNVVGTLGNHEFDEGKEELHRLIFGGNHPSGPFLEAKYRGARFPYVSSNVIDTSTGKLLLPAFVIRTVAGVKVGVVGAVLQTAPQLFPPGQGAGLEFLDEVTSINAQVATLKRRGVHTIIVALHKGSSQSAYTGKTDPAGVPGATIRDLVARLDDDVDLVLSGHSHTFTNAIVENEHGYPILVTQAQSSGEALAQVDLFLDPATGDVAEKWARIVTTYSDVAPGNSRDPAVQAIVDAAVARTAPVVNERVASISGDLLRSQNAAGECGVGDLVADAMRITKGTDFAFMQTGGLRSDLRYAATPSNPADSPGTVLWGELFAIQPFANVVVTMNLTGQAIYDLLEEQWTMNSTLEVSGLDYTWDAARPVGGRVIQVRRNGAPIDRAATYFVTVNDYIAQPEDGFQTLRRGTNRVDGPVDLEALVSYVRNAPQPVAVPNLGRITRLH